MKLEQTMDFYFDENLFVIIDSHSIEVLVNKSIQQNGKTKLRILKFTRINYIQLTLI